MDTELVFPAVKGNQLIQTDASLIAEEFDVGFGICLARNLIEAR